MRESKIEKEVCDYAKSKGWEVYKWTSPGKKGVPDRMFMRKGCLFFIEFKATDKPLTKQQDKRAREIMAQAFIVYRGVDDIARGKKIIDNHEDFDEIA